MTGAHPGLAGGPVYLDYNATTPVDPRVVEAMLPYLSAFFGNPSSGHAYAQQPRRALAEARREVASLVGARTEPIVFTGSGSEADTLAIRGAALGHAERPRVVTQGTEHPAVLEACHALERLHGAEVTRLRVGADGLVDPATLVGALASPATLVSIMTANNETGVLQPIERLAAIAHAHGALFHTDAAQAAGKIPIEVNKWDVDLLTIAGHKMYAPKGIGALYIRPGLGLEPVVYGGGQEGGLRAGTENVALAVALGAAARIAVGELADGAAHRTRELRDMLYQLLDDLLPGRVQLNGHRYHRLPGTLNVSIAGVHADDLLAATPGIAASTGAACHAGISEPSPVLLAMGHEPGRALSALRLSLGRWTTREDVEYAAEQIARTARSQVQADRGIVTGQRQALAKAADLPEVHRC